MPPSELKSNLRLSGLKAEVDRLARTLHGQILLPQDANYDSARRIWNGMIDRRPAAIARCAEQEDVGKAIRFARRLGLTAAVKGGGTQRSWQRDLRRRLDDFIFSLMRAVKVDAERRVAVVQGGCLLADMDRATQSQGLATPAGIVSTTGVGGLTLGGGFGLERKSGLTIHSLLSARMVNANGESIVAGSRENEDLFWAIRGGGGNFGIATSFEFRLHPVGPQVFCGLIIRPFEQAEAYLRFHREFVRTLPDDVTVWIGHPAGAATSLFAAGCARAPGSRAALHLSGDQASGERYIEPLRKFPGASHGEAFGPSEFVGWQTAFSMG